MPVTVDEIRDGATVDDRSHWREIEHDEVECAPEQIHKLLQLGGRHEFARMNMQIATDRRQEMHSVPEQREALQQS